MSRACQPWSVIATSGGDACRGLGAHSRCHRGDCKIEQLERVLPRAVARRIHPDRERPDTSTSSSRLRRVLERLAAWHEARIRIRTWRTR